MISVNYFIIKITEIDFQMHQIFMKLLHLIAEIKQLKNNQKH